MTRAEDESGPLGSALRARGLTPVSCPLLVEALLDDQTPLRDAAARLASYDWIVVASTRAVDALGAHRDGPWARRHALRPFVSDLRRKVESIRQAELARAAGELSDSRAMDVQLLDRLSRRLLDQVLAIPFATLETGEVPLDPAQAQYLRRLFALGPGADA